MSEPPSIGRYYILTEIGRGAMGVVYKARDPKMDRVVAIKTIQGMALSGPQAQEYRDRFTREARAAGRLSHPGIVAVYDVSDHEGTPYLVMEFVEGRTLESSLHAGERFPFDRIEEIGEQLAAALGYAHRNGVVHRDVKPANILLTAPSAQSPERVKITDLGIAKLSASQITTTGQLLGTPSYMPPEQFTGAPVDGRADLFSLGVILYWMATGDKPFAGDTITAVSYKIVHTDTIPPRRLNPAVPEGLENVILRCLEKDPARRYQTGELLAQDLAALRAGGTVAPLPGRRVSESTTIGAADPRLTVKSRATMDQAKDQPDDGMTMAGAPAPRVVTPASQHQTLPAQPKPAANAERTAPRKPNKNAVVIGVGALLVLILIVGAVIQQKRAARLAAHESSPSTTSAQAPAPQPADAQSAISAAAPAATADSGSSASQTAAQQPPDTTGTSGTSAAASKSPPLPNSVRPGKSSPGKTQSGQGNRSGGTPSSDSNAAKNDAQKSDAGQAKSAELPPVPLPTTAVPNVTAAAQPAASPKAAELKPDESARIHIDAGHVPDAIGFIVLMDGKPIYQRADAAAAAGKSEEPLVAPGQHEFKVIAASGGVKLGASNSVRGDFQARKKKTLRIELRDFATGKTMNKSAKLTDGGADFIISIRTGIF